MADNDLVGIHLGFFSKALKDDPNPLALIGVDGREEISRLFEFDLLLFRRGEPLEEEQLEQLVSDPCVIALGTAKTDIVHGVLSDIEHVGGARGLGAYYRARLSPYISLLTLGRRSAIYQQTTMPAMVEQILISYGLAKGKNFDIHVAEAAKSPEHEYVVQFNESDWDFIQRWLDKEGFFYWFRHTAKGVVLEIADTNGDTTPIDDPTTIAHRERNNLASEGDESIWGFQVRHRRVQASVTLVDYNYRRPLDLLISTKPVDAKGFGHVVNYGEHFKETGLGDEWARVRSEELAAVRRVVSGTTDCARLRVGHSFDLENHYFGAYDGKYLLTAVQHSAGVPTSNLPDDFASLPAARPYRARFTAIPFAVPFRPRPRAAWPKIEGVINAHVEADTAGELAQIDDQGRYKVKFPFDLGTQKGLPASRWIRMAQSYAGTSYGQHMPNHKGTEVLIAHIDGDPDRPVIVGAVPNPVTPSPVVSANATQSVLQTASGIRVELEDQA